MNPTLYYVHDPMCSWCFGFENTRRQIFSALEDRMPIVRLLGGLAPDSDDPMPQATQMMVMQAWQRIEQMIPGTRFNFDFWDKNQPRRSTYPANRAVIAARLQGAEFDSIMTGRIQQAYYQQAKNPSDNEILVELAADIGLDRERFENDLKDESTQARLLDEIGQARSIGINSFPSLAIVIGDRVGHVGLDYNSPQVMLQQIEQYAGL